MGMIRAVLRRIMRKRPEHKAGRFSLWYHASAGARPVTVGYLKFEGGWWTFEYDTDYRHRPDLRPIEGFDDLERVYRSRVLFPFFAVRIPDQDRPDVRRRLEEQKIRDPETSDLLRVYGRRAVASPNFELVEA
jgi:HipA-like protein